MALFDFLKGLTSADRAELDQKYQKKEPNKGLSDENFTKEYKATLDRGFQIPEGFVLLAKSDIPKPFEIPEGYGFMSNDQAEKLKGLSNYTPPKDYTAKYILVKQDGKSIPMEFEVFKTKPAKLPENQINIIL